MGAIGLILGGTLALASKETWPVVLGIGLGRGISLLQLPVRLAIVLRIRRLRASLALDILAGNIVMLSRLRNNRLQSSLRA